MRIGATCLKRCLLLFAILCVLASTAVGGRVVQLPAVTLTPSSSNLVLAPPECDVCGPSKSLVVELSANTQNFRKGSLLYSYSITGGRITGEGNKVSWDLTALSAGTYTATVEVETINPRQSATASTSVTITNCSCDRRRPDPTINVSCPMTPSCTDPVSFDVSISNVPEGANLTYKWVVAGGTITSGQGTTSILVQLEKNYGSVTATVEVGGLDPPMGNTSSCSMRTFCDVHPPATKVDEFGMMNWGHVTNRLDSFAVQLNNDIGEGDLIYCVGPSTLPGAGLRFADRIKDYLVNIRGIDPSRLTIKEQTCERFTMQLWDVQPGGAEPPISPAVERSAVNSPAYFYDKYSYFCYSMFHPALRDRAACEDEPHKPGEHSDALKVFGGTVASVPGAKALLVVYPGPSDKQATLNKFIRSEKDFLVSNFKIDPANILTKFGARRHIPIVELWLVPPGATVR